MSAIEEEYRVRAQRLKQLGFLREHVDWRKPSPAIDAAYQAYLRSDLWRNAKVRFSGGDTEKLCYVCGQAGQELHHLTYARLGREPTSDLVSLCREHHTAVSDAIYATRRGLSSAHRHHRTLWLQAWLRPHAAAIMDRLAQASVSGHIDKHDAPVRMRARYVDWTARFDLGIWTTDEDAFCLDLRFPGGPGTTAFELRNYGAALGETWDVEIIPSRDYERRKALASHPNEPHLWPRWLQEERVNAIPPRRFPPRWR